MAANVPNTKNPNRIITLDPFEDIDHPNTIRDILYNPSKAAHWHVAVDYKSDTDDPENPDVETPIDYGTKRIPVSRLAFRNESGLIPRQMLPDYVEDVVYGSFTPDSDTTSFTGYAKFTTNDNYEPGPGEDPSWSSNLIEYRYPYTFNPQTPWIKVADENLIYMDTDDTHDFYKLQFRFKEPASGQQQNEFHGFNILPSTKAIVQGYGIQVSETNTTTTIAARKANSFTVRASNVFMDGYNIVVMPVQDSDVGIAFGESKLVKNTTYIVTAELSVQVASAAKLKPRKYLTTLSVAGAGSGSSAQFDVDMATLEEQSFSVSFAFTVGNSSCTMVLGINEQDNQSVKLSNGFFTVTEVL